MHDERDTHRKMNNYIEFLKYSGLTYSQYQFDGVKWMIEKESCSEVRYGSGGGGIIADEMGLGKTIMMIGTFISNLLPKTLIVVPLILIEQWKQQILKTTGYRVIVYHGSTKPDVSFMTDGYGCGYGCGTRSSSKTHIVITTYHTLVSSRILHDIQWNRVVYDEAHHLRNKNTQCHQVASALKSDIRWLITGTPIQNSEKDLENLCSIARIPCDCVDEFILRRTKKEVGISMPELSETVEMIQWRPETREHKLGSHFHRVWQKIREKKEGLILPAMLRAKQVCIMPKIVNTVELYDPLATTDAGAGAAAVAVEPMPMPMPMPMPLPSIVVETENSKIDRVIQIIIERKLNGNQKIIFCHFHAEIDVIMVCLMDAGMTVGVMDGRRKCAVSDVDENDVLIIQIQTGCEGLNLQKFNEIYFIGPHWNPAVEDQAIARCHRIGQLKPVIVYRFIMEKFDDCESLDMYIRDIQEKKRGLVRDMFDI